MKLEEFLERKDIAPVIAIDFIPIVIDARMPSCGALTSRFGKKGGGIPWIAFVAADGTAKATGDDADGKNIGYPHAKEEVAHFVTMLNAVRKRLSSEQIGFLEKELHLVRERDEAKRKR